MRSHTPVGLAAGTLSLSSCQPGQTVLVMWEPAHLNYTVMQVCIDVRSSLEIDITTKQKVNAATGIKTIDLTSSWTIVYL